MIKKLITISKEKSFKIFLDSELQQKNRIFPDSFWKDLSNDIKIVSDKQIFKKFYLFKVRVYFFPGHAVYLHN